MTKLFSVLLFIQLGVLLVSAQHSVSGISSGGFAAVQFHVAYSSNLVGAGIIAGGPYWCANANVALALTSCMTNPELISVTELITATDYALAALSIDDPNNLSRQKVWIYSGTNDTVVYPGVVKKLEQYYNYWISPRNIQTVYNIPSEHAFITNDYGNSCGTLDAPYINNCKFDAAGAILTWIYGELNPRATQMNTSNLFEIDQTQFIPYPYTTSTASMYSNAYIYVPTSCQQKTGDCKVHIAFHGCLQTIDDIGSKFYMNAGYNEWAETNDFIIIYPQAAANTLNPKGCWDWWGYTGADYATQAAPQMYATKKMLEYAVSKWTTQ